MTTNDGNESGRVDVEGGLLLTAAVGMIRRHFGAVAAVAPQHKVAEFLLQAFARTVAAVVQFFALQFELIFD